MPEVLQWLLPEILLRLVAPVLGRFTNIRWLSLESPRAMTVGFDYRYVSIRVRNRGNTAIEGCRVHLQSYRDARSGGEVLIRDEFLPWAEDQDYRGQMSASHSVPKRIPPGSGEAQIVIAVARADDNTQSVELCTSMRDDPTDASMLLSVWPDNAPAVLSIRVIGDDYASRPARIRLCIDDAGTRSWSTVRVERAIMFRDALRIMLCWIQRGVRLLGQVLRVRERVSRR